MGDLSAVIGHPRSCGALLVTSAMPGPRLQGVGKKLASQSRTLQKPSAVWILHKPRARGQELSMRMRDLTRIASLCCRQNSRRRLNEAAADCLDESDFGD